MTAGDDGGTDRDGQHGLGQGQAWKPAAGGLGVELGDWQLFLRRSLRSDFYGERATDAERQRLASAALPVTTPLAQDYAAWRRGMLWVTAMAMVVTVIFQLIETIKALADEPTPGVLKFMVVVLFIMQISASVLIGLAALSWCDLIKSRKNARFAWLLVFLGPFLVYCLPVGTFAADEPMQQLQIGVLMAFGAAIDLFPRIIGLFAGIIRSSLTLKTLLPESNTPGWMAVIIAPLYILFFLIALIVVIQSTISFWLVLALLAFIGAPVLLLMRTKTLMQSLEPEEGHKIVMQIRRSSAMCMVAAFVFFLIFAIVTDLDILNISVWSLLNGVFAFLAGVLLLTTVMSDFMLSMLIHSYAQGQSFRGSAMDDTLSAKYAELTDVGLGQLDIGETELIRKLGGAAKAAGRKGKDWVAAEDSAGPIWARPTPPDAPADPPKESKQPDKP